jgi:hypothetical protein
LASGFAITIFFARVNFFRAMSWIGDVRRRLARACMNMGARDIAAMLLLAAGLATHARGAPIDGPGAAIEAAKRYTKGRCTTETPCTYKPQREGKQWRVWVARTERSGRKDARTVVLYFDLNGNLIRRIEGE